MTHPHRTCRPTRRRAWLLATAPLAFALIMLAGVAYVMADDGATESATDDGAKATDAIEEKTESETPASDAESSEVTESEVAKVGTADEPAESTPSETPGQSLLGDATRARLTASNFRDLNEVVRLLDEAIKKGLDEASTKIARQMLAGTLLERGRTVTGAILTQHRRNRRWPEMRTMAVGDLRRVLKVDQQNVEAHFLLSQLWLMPGGDRTAALESLDVVVAREDAPAQMRAKALLLRAELQSDDQQRLADYQQAIDLAPDNVEAFRARLKKKAKEMVVKKYEKYM